MDSIETSISRENHVVKDCHDYSQIQHSLEIEVPVYMMNGECQMPNKTLKKCSSYHIYNLMLCCIIDNGWFENLQASASLMLADHVK